MNEQSKRPSVVVTVGAAQQVYSGKPAPVPDPPLDRIGVDQNGRIWLINGLSKDEAITQLLTEVARLRSGVTSLAKQCDREDRADTEPPSWWEIADKLWTLVEREGF